MVLVSSITRQEQASSGGVVAYPQVSGIKQFSKFMDDFNRENVNVSGMAVLYTASSDNGSNTIFAGSQLLMSTGTTIGGANSIRTNSFGITRQASTIDARSSIKFTGVFQVSALPLASFVFFGLLNSQSALSALPTTVRNLGVFLDKASSDNWFTTSANGSTQVTEDTGIDHTSSAIITMEIEISGDNAATIKIWIGSTTVGDPDFTDTVTALSLSTSLPFEVHFYSETGAASSFNSIVHEYAVELA